MYIPYGRFAPKIVVYIYGIYMQCDIHDHDDIRYKTGIVNYIILFNHHANHQVKITDVKENKFVK